MKEQEFGSKSSVFWFSFFIFIFFNMSWDPRATDPSSTSNNWSTESYNSGYSSSYRSDKVNGSKLQPITWDLSKLPKFEKDFYHVFKFIKSFDLFFLGTSSSYSFI